MKAAFLLPTEIAGSVVWSSCFDEDFADCKRTVGVIMGQLGIVSAYLEDSSYKLEDFVATVVEIEKQLEKLNVLGCKHLALGCDLDNALPSGIYKRTGTFVKDEPKVEHAARVERFLKLLADHEMYVANTYGDGDKTKSFTRIPWTNDQKSTQIDFVCLSHGLDMSSPFIPLNNQFDGDRCRLNGRYHFPVSGRIELRTNTRTRSTRKSLWLQID